MTTESVLLLGLFAFILGGIFLNPNSGPVATYRASGPRLGAMVERDLSVGCGCELQQNGVYLGFYKAGSHPGPSIVWADPGSN